jgi:hypothetical protein
MAQDQRGPAAYSFDPATGALTPVEPGRIGKVVVAAEWCEGGHDNSFHSYPGDGECPCGFHKHHVHGVCGHVTQVG